MFPPQPDQPGRMFPPKPDQPGGVFPPQPPRTDRPSTGEYWLAWFAGLIGPAFAYVSIMMWAHETSYMRGHGFRIGWGPYVFSAGSLLIAFSGAIFLVMLIRDHFVPSSGRRRVARWAKTMFCLTFPLGLIMFCSSLDMGVTGF